MRRSPQDAVFRSSATGIYHKIFPQTDLHHATEAVLLPFFGFIRLRFDNTDKFPELCRQKNWTMKKTLEAILAVLMLVSCERETLPGVDRSPSGEICHGMIELGEKLEDPYAIDNMKAALARLYPSKAERTDIHPTDLYVRFLPESDAQLETLLESGIYLMDHPMDYRIVREGDWYHDPSLDEGKITWQYAVVDSGYSFPDGIEWELLDRCYISEHDPDTRAAGDGIDWDAVEREAFAITGNIDMLQPCTKADGSGTPHGRITVEDPQVSGGKPLGLSGVMVAANVFVKIAICHTDRDGYYSMGTAFSSNPRYRLVFQNTAGFSIGFNLILVPASVSTLASGPPQGIDFTITEESDAALFRRTAVNQAAYDYYTRCPSMEVASPPADVRFWIFPFLDKSATVMMHHGAFLDNSLVSQYLDTYAYIAKIFLPDITIGTKGSDNFADIYESTVHELSHSSHYAKVGNDYWTPYINYIIESFVTEGRQPYGTGVSDGAGLCEVGEMWAYFMAASMKKERYGGSFPEFGFWFKPEILCYLYERGMSRKEIFAALTPEVISAEALKNKLLALYENRYTLISETFKYYGK